MGVPKDNGELARRDAVAVEELLGQFADADEPLFFLGNERQLFN